MKERVQCHLWRRRWLGSSVAATAMLLLFPCKDTSPYVFCFSLFSVFFLLSFFSLFLCFFFLFLPFFFLLLHLLSSFSAFSSFAFIDKNIRRRPTTPVQSWHKGRVARAATVQLPQDHPRGMSPLFFALWYATSQSLGK